jgi:glucose-6-phosphate isomerase
MRSSASSRPQSLIERPQWLALTEHRGQIEHRHLRELFAADPSRGERLVAEAAGLYLDYSKNRITDETLRLLQALAESCSIRERIDAMFRGVSSTSGSAAPTLARSWHMRRYAITASVT